jgi:hypothetical protein
MCLCYIALGSAILARVYITAGQAEHRVETQHIPRSVGRTA